MSDFYVADKYRTNPESLYPGGYDVKIFYADGSSRVYKRVKNPELYFKSAQRSSNVVNYEILGESDHEINYE
jgi:hypothetical protein